MVGEAPFGNVVFVKWCDVCAVYVCACVSVCVCMALHVRTWRLFDSVYGCCVCVYGCCVCVCMCGVCGAICKGSYVLYADTFPAWTDLVYISIYDRFNVRMIFNSTYIY